MNGLEALTGLQEDPKNALPDGTRYEYDPILKRTVEVTPSGERFPVTLVDGKLLPKWVHRIPVFSRFPRASSTCCRSQEIANLFITPNRGNGNQKPSRSHTFELSSPFQMAT